MQLHGWIRLDGKGYLTPANCTVKMRWEMASVAMLPRNDTRMTPLMCAAGMGHATAVEMLLQHGAKVKAKDRAGNTALHYACQAPKDGGYAVVQILLKHGADINARNRSGITPLQVALNRGNHKCAGLLRQYGAKE